MLARSSEAMRPVVKPPAIVSLMLAVPSLRSLVSLASVTLPDVVQFAVLSAVVSTVAVTPSAFIEPTSSMLLAAVSTPELTASLLTLAAKMPALSTT